MKKKIAILAASLWTLSTSTLADTVIHAGQFFAGTGDTLQSKMTLVIKDNKIASISKGFKAASAQDTLIDLSDSTVMPGLMDMHVHLSSQHGGPQTYLERYTLNEADYALQAANYAQKTLLAGFTTVRNLGDSYNETVALRNAINKGVAAGPRIYTAAKSIATTGGHADPANGMATTIQPDVGPRQGVINGTAQAREAVRQRYKDGADVIKITATGGVLSVAKSGQNPQFMEDEVSAIVATANDYGMTVAVHAHGEEGMKRAIRAGVISIEHGTYMDKEAIALMKEHGTYYVPTIMAGKFVAEKAKIEGYFPALVRPKAAAIGPLIQDTFGRAYKAGVNIAFGTDSGVSAHGDNAREFGYMVEAGMPPAKALQSAMLNAAKMLKIDDQLGSLESGKLADIVAVKGNPLEDISVMNRITFVMKDGAVVKQ
ncbi:metal-dependent hydrolase family protein [Salinimonas sediminis]|uniref:Amidohydrolase family protein n=1 Tax=Salinimonas sediminis TaxID=2303538 RepID=A0A346NHC3_9ALTE|nr:amidohydrolase family protein [Salinimonas sediminis]AXR04930.1 amidohydrolase family protein [Salinimonas sediminis]